MDWSIIFVFIIGVLIFYIAISYRGNDLEEFKEEIYNDLTNYVKESELENKIPKDYIKQEDLIKIENKISEDYAKKSELTVKSLSKNQLQEAKDFYNNNVLRRSWVQNIIKYPVGLSKVKINSLYIFPNLNYGWIIASSDLNPIAFSSVFTKEDHDIHSRKIIALRVRLDRNSNFGSIFYNDRYLGNNFKNEFLIPVKNLDTDMERFRFDTRWGEEKSNINILENMLSTMSSINRFKDSIKYDDLKYEKEGKLLFNLRWVYEFRGNFYNSPLFINFKIECSHPHTILLLIKCRGSNNDFFMRNYIPCSSRGIPDELNSVEDAKYYNTQYTQLFTTSIIANQAITNEGEKCGIPYEIRDIKLIIKIPDNTESLDVKIINKAFMNMSYPKAFINDYFVCEITGDVDLPNITIEAVLDDNKQETRRYIELLKS